ncbi:MAG: PKD domain-containing protein [Bacteroidota bacterium]
MRLTLSTLFLSALFLWGGNALGQLTVQADFVASITNGCTPVTVSFTDQSTGTPAPTSWFWSFGDGASSTLQNPTHIYQQAGWFWVTLSVSNGSSTDSTAMWLNFTGPQVWAINPSTQLSCGPGPITFTGAVDTVGIPLIWEWDVSGPQSFSSMDSAATFNFTLPGTYQVQVKVTNPGGCSDSMLTTIVIPPGMIINTTVVDATCGNSDGSATANVTGGQSPYSYTWSNGATTPTISNLGPGTYVVAVADVNGCSELDTVDIQNLGISLSSSVQNPSCDNVDDGYIVITPSSGVAPFTYAWNTGATTDSIGGLGSGNYWVTVTDNNGCAASDSFLLDATPFAMVVSTTDADCNGAGGGATLAINGGVAPYNIVWTSGATDTLDVSLAVGGYSVYVADYAGCEDHEVFYVEYADSCTINISGRMYYDSNMDCVYDSTIDFAVPGWVSLSNGQGVIAGLDGTYEFEVFPGTYSVSYNTNFFPFLTPICPTNGLHLLTNQTTDIANVDFALDSDSVFQDLKVNLWKGNIRPGFLHTYYIHVWNEGVLPANGILTFTYDPLVSVSNFSVNPTTFNPANNTASWVLPTLAPGQHFWLTITGGIGTSVPVGTLITTVAQVDPIANDVTPYNNVDTCYRNVTNSFDPNDKQVTPQGEGPEGFIGQDEQDMRYTVRFQNTGNDTAFIVVIRDTIEGDLDITTFKPSTFSHPYELTIEDGNTLVFTFDNIFLVDSTTNEPESHGHVSFVMRHNGTLPYGTEITNRAAIYFDFNEPIITNTALNTIASPTALEEDLSQYIKVYPNPSFGDLVITYETITVEDVSVYDLSGKLIQRKTDLHPGRIELSLQDQTAGNYLVLLNTNKGPISQKITLRR